MSQKSSRGFSRAGSDGLIKTTSVTKPTPQRQLSSADSKRRTFQGAPTIKSLTNVIRNGSHSAAMNGGSHDNRGSVKKSPLLPPAHLREKKKSNSSDSSVSSGNSLLGSVNRTAESAVQLSNQDSQLPNSSPNQPSGKLMLL